MDKRIFLIGIFLMVLLGNVNAWEIFPISAGNMTTPDLVVPLTAITDTKTDGDVCFIFHDNYTKSLKYSCFDGQTIYDEYVVDEYSNNFRGLYFALDLDKNDKPHICVVNATNEAINYYTFQDNIALFNKTEIYSGGLNEETCSIYTDSENRPHIVYSTNTGSILEKFLYTGGWAQADIGAGTSSRHPLIYISDNKKYVIYNKDVNYNIVVKNSTVLGTTYSLSYEMPGNADAYSIIYDLEGVNDDLYFITQNSTSDYVKKNNISINIEDEDEEFSISVYKGNVFYVYTDSDNNIRFVKNTSGSFNDVLEIVSVDDVTPSLEIDSTGDRWFLYQDSGYVYIAFENVSGGIDSCYCNGEACSCDNFIFVYTVNESYEALPECNVTFQYQYFFTDYTYFTGNTDASGHLEHSVRYAGNHYSIIVEVSKKGYEVKGSGRQSVLLTSCNQDFSAVFQLYKVNRNHNVQFTFSDCETGIKLPDVNVLCDQLFNSSKNCSSVSSDLNGDANFTNMDTGYYFFTFLKNNYQVENTYSPLWIDSDMEKNYCLVNISKTYILNLSVIDNNNSQLINGIRIDWINSQGGDIDSGFCYTNSQGFCYITGLHYGNYDFSLKDIGGIYQSKSINILIDKSMNKTVGLDRKNETKEIDICFYREEREIIIGDPTTYEGSLLPVTNIQFFLFLNDNNVTLLGQYDTQESNCKRIQIGKYNYGGLIQPNVYGYNPNKYLIDISSSHLLDNDDAIEIILEPQGETIDIIARVLDRGSNTPVTDAYVSVYGCDGLFLSSAPVNSEGEVIFPLFAKICYKFKAESESYGVGESGEVFPTYEDKVIKIYLGTSPEEVLSKIKYYMYLIWWLPFIVVVIFLIYGGTGMLGATIHNILGRGGGNNRNVY